MSVVAIGTEAEEVETVHWCCEDSCKRAKIQDELFKLQVGLSLFLKIFSEATLLAIFVGGATEYPQ